MLGAGLALPLLAACGGAASATVSTGSASEAPATSSAASTAPLATSTATSAANSAPTLVTTVASSATTSSSASGPATSAGATTSASAAAPAANSAVGAQAITLQVASRRTGGTDAAKLEQALYDDFAKGVPGLRVQITYGVDPEQELIVHHAGGTPLDYVYNDWGTWSDLATKQVIADLTPYFQQAKINMDIFAAQAVQNYSLQQKIYGLPVTMSVDALAYNVELFDTHGLAHPPVDTKDATWTMEKFLEVAQKRTKGDGTQFGFSGSANGYNTAGCTDGTYFGMPSWDDSAQQSRYDSAEWAKGSHYWLDLRTKYNVQPNSDQAKQIKANLPDIFVSGKIGMSVVYSINWQPSQIPFHWALATIPYSGTGNNISARMYPSGLHMDASSPHKDVVWQLFQWLTIPANGGRYPLVAGHSVSPLLNGGSDLAQKTRQEQWGIDPKAFLLESYTELPSGTGILKYANWPNIAKQLTQPYADVQALKTSPEDYGRSAAQLVNANIFKTS